MIRALLWSRPLLSRSYSTKVNEFYQPVCTYTKEYVKPERKTLDADALLARHRIKWTNQDVQDAAQRHVLSIWSNTDRTKPMKHIKKGEGPYLFTADGHRLLDFNSQAVCANLGYTVPEEIVEGVEKQMRELPYCYTDIVGITEVRVRLSADNPAMHRSPAPGCHIPIHSSSLVRRGSWARVQPRW